jgi:hypothetical protein
MVMTLHCLTPNVTEAASQPSVTGANVAPPVAFDETNHAVIMD